MANAVYNLAKGTNAYKLVLLAKGHLGQGTASTSLDGLGSAEGDVDVILPQAVNTELGAALDKLTFLNRTTVNVTMTAGTRTSAIPTNVRQVLELKYGRDEDRQSLPIKTVSFHEIRMRPEEWHRDDYTQDYPEFAVMDADDNGTSCNFLWFGLPETTRVVELVYQPTFTMITLAEIENAASTTYLPVPDEMVDIPAHMLAANFAARIWGVDDRRVFAHRRQADMLIASWVRKLVRPPAVVAAQRMEQAGYAKSFHGGRGANFSRRRGGGRY